MNRKADVLKKSFKISIDNHHLCAQWIRPGNGVGSQNNSNNGCNDRPILVFLHEGLGSIAQWRDFPGRLCRATDCCGLVYERWGFGNSDALLRDRSSQYLYDEAFNTLPQILKACHINRSILIGHSDGGTIALLHAANNHNKVLGLITEAAHVFVEEITLAGIKKAVKAYKNSNLKAKLAQYHGENTDRIFHTWADTWLDPSFRNWNIEAYLPMITAPLLAIQGENDEYGSLAQVKSIVDHVMGPAKSLIIPDCGHIPHHQALEIVLAVMKSFIEQLINFKLFLPE
ncbi:MAG: alpha/beta hydrolase [Desulfobacterales bacterium]|nr:alpha/beta hydrolase [Desulfobacterales bacterium]